MTPFPEYPILHVQMKLSSVLTHCELLLQLSKPREHSSISKSKIIKKYIRITRETKVYAGTGSNNISKEKKKTIRACYYLFPSFAMVTRSLYLCLIV